MIALFLLAGFAAPWAESPLLVRKAVDPSFFAVGSMSDLRWRPFGDIAPRARAGEDPGAEGWTWEGRSVPALDPWDGDSSIRGGVGNEIGDELFRETGGEDADNRTPAIQAMATTPRRMGWRVGALFDQVDHFSDRTMQARSRRLGEPSISVVDPSVRRAFFGENLPDQSFAGLHADGPAGPVGVAGASRTGWIWLPSPASRDLECWRASTAEGKLSLGRWTIDQAWGGFDRADTASGWFRQLQGRAGGAWGDSSIRLRGGLEWSRVDRGGSLAWRPPSGWRALAFAEHRVAFGPWETRGSNRAGPDLFLLADTLEWSATPWGRNLSILAGGRWSDRPDGQPGWRDSSRAGWARMEASAMEGDWIVRARLAGVDGPLAWELVSQPWAVSRPRAFAVEGFDSSDGWIARSGREVALPGLLRGWKNRVAANLALRPGFSVDGSLQYDPVLGGPSSRTDLSAPEWGASMGLSVAHRSGFSIRPLLLWRSSSVVRNESPRPWTIPAAWDANLWVDQSYFGGRLVFSCAVLNALSRDPVETPDGAEDRFRILVQMTLRPWD